MKPNCSTCDNWDNFYSSCKLLAYNARFSGVKEKIHPRIDRDDEWLLYQVGCLSHPKAQEYLNAGVIRELERLYEIESHYATMFSSSYREGLADGYDTAIALIKEGVRK